MLFNSYTFILFFIVVIVLHNYTALSWRFKKVNLLAASYLFYAVWNPPFILLLWISTLIDFFVGKKLYHAGGKTNRNLLLTISLIGNLGMLGFFKYGGFLLENFVLLANAMGVDYQPAQPNIILPVGISFYTFQTLSYTLDMYKKRCAPEKSILDFSLFVTFFPQLVAGPIVRPTQLLPQFKTPHIASRQQMVNGLFLLTLGLFMKVVLADGMLAPSSDSVFGAATRLQAIDAWLGVLAFSGQIFFDFAGYSTCAIGIASCIGFTLPENFRYPYAAAGFSDFWRRWHITLSTWLRDYLYIPLGGNRRGEVRTYINLMLTMLIGGLWHGASWTFVVWGGLHGSYLCIERLLKRRPAKETGNIEEPVPVVVSASFINAAVLRNKKINRFLTILLTFFLINITWVFFRAQDFDTAWRLLLSMFTSTTGGTMVLSTLGMIKVIVVITLMVASHWMLRNRNILSVGTKAPWWLTGSAWAVMIIFLILSQQSSSSFIYFQF